MANRTLTPQPERAPLDAALAQLDLLINHERAELQSRASMLSALVTLHYQLTHLEPGRSAPASVMSLLRRVLLEHLAAEERAARAAVMATPALMATAKAALAVQQHVRPSAPTAIIRRSTAEAELSRLVISVQPVERSTSP